MTFSRYDARPQPSGKSTAASAAHIRRKLEGMGDAAVQAVQDALGAERIWTDHSGNIRQVPDYALRFAAASYVIDHMIGRPGQPLTVTDETGGSAAQRALALEFARRVIAEGKGALLPPGVLAIAAADAANSA